MQEKNKCTLEADLLRFIDARVKEVEENDYFNGGNIQKMLYLKGFTDGIYLGKDSEIIV